MPHKDLDKVVPAADVTLLEVLQPGSYGVH
jgi:hypothetical protein